MIESGTTAYWRATLALSLGSILIFANLYTPQPLLPLLRAGFGVTELQASLSVTAATLTLGLSLLIYGPLSDAIGRRPLMLVTMALATLCTLAIPLATDFSTLLALRALQGLFLGGLPAVALAYMGDEFKHDAMLLAVGVYIGANSVGGISGRLMSGLAGAQWGWEGSFLAAGLISLLILAVFAWALPPSRGFHPAPLRLGRMAKDLGRHLRNPSVLVACLIGGINFMVFYYGGASIGGVYLGPFWNWLAWPGVVAGALLGFAVALVLALWLRWRECQGPISDAIRTEPATCVGCGPN